MLEDGKNNSKNEKELNEFKKNAMQQPLKSQGFMDNIKHRYFACLQNKFGDLIRVIMGKGNKKLRMSKDLKIPLFKWKCLVPKPRNQ